MRQGAPSSRSSTRRTGVLTTLLYIEILLVTALFLLGSVFGLRWNWSPSIPRGLYREVPFTNPTVGTLVLYCLPDSTALLAGRRGYVQSGTRCPGHLEPSGKPILGLPGDTLAHWPDHLSRNGVPVPHSATRSTDREGRPVPHAPWGVQVLQPNEYWLFSPYHPAAFDSRYYGAVHRSQIHGRLLPLLTFP